MKLLVLIAAVILFAACGKSTEVASVPSTDAAVDADSVDVADAVTPSDDVTAAAAPADVSATK